MWRTGPPRHVARLGGTKMARPAHRWKGAEDRSVTRGGRHGGNGTGDGTAPAPFPAGRKSPGGARRQAWRGRRPRHGVGDADQAASVALAFASSGACSSSGVTLRSLTLASSSMKSTTFSSKSGARMLSMACGLRWKYSITCFSWPG